MTSTNQTSMSTAQPGALAALSPEAIIRTLTALPGADEWQLEVLRDDETQLYLIGDRPEGRRAVTNLRARVTLHNDHTPRDPSSGSRARGTASIALLPEDVANPAEMVARLQEGVAMAGLTDNLPFHLPAPP